MTAGDDGFDVVTGAFSYSGAAIAQELQAAGRRVRTLTGHPGRAPAGTGIDVRPLDFADPAALAESLRGATTLYNTYWVRFAHGAVDHEAAVANSRVLFYAARRGGRAADRARLDHPPEPRLALSLLPGQGRRSSRRWPSWASPTGSFARRSSSAATAS